MAKSWQWSTAMDSKSQSEIGQPGTAFSMPLQSIDGECAYALWSAETADNV